MNINRTVIVTAATAPLARQLAEYVSPGGVNMFQTPLYTGVNITHYVSSGWIKEEFDLALTDANYLFSICDGLATLVQCQNLINTSIVVDCDLEDAYSTYARLGLTI